MKIFVAVNQVAEIGYRQTTALLIAALVRQGHVVSLANVEDFSVDTSVESAGAQTVAFSVNSSIVTPSDDTDSFAIEKFVRSASAKTMQSISVDDVILIRTNPGRDTQRAEAHESFLDICRAAKSHGIRVMNDPSLLQYFASKASLAAADPRFCPPMIVSSQNDRIVEFVQRSGTNCVIKPLVGSRGQNVIRVSHNQNDLDSLVSSTYGTTAVVAQHFVNADQPGDKRVILVNGKILEIDKHLAGIQRRPAVGDFRANLHTGGSAHPLKLTASERTTAEYAGELLFRNGISLAGVDLIGDKIIEFNVFSTGGIYDSEGFSGIDFSAEIVRRLWAS